MKKNNKEVDSDSICRNTGNTYCRNNIWLVLPCRLCLDKQTTIA